MLITWFWSFCFCFVGMRCTIFESTAGFEVWRSSDIAQTNHLDLIPGMPGNRMDSDLKYSNSRINEAIMRFKRIPFPHFCQELESAIFGCESELSKFYLRNLGSVVFKTYFLEFTCLGCQICKGASPLTPLKSPLNLSPKEHLCSFMTYKVGFILIYLDR